MTDLISMENAGTINDIFFFLSSSPNQCMVVLEEKERNLYKK